MTLQPDATFEAASYLWFPKQIILIDANIKNQIVTVKIQYPEFFVSQRIFGFIEVQNFSDDNILVTFNTIWNKTAFHDRQHIFFRY